MALRRKLSRLALGLLALSACGSSPEPDAPVAAAKIAEPSKPPEAAPVVAVQVLAINDLHGHLEPPDGLGGLVFDGQADIDSGGVTHLAAWIDELRRANPNTVVVSAGDLVGASPLVSAMFHDEPTIEAMNKIGLDINAVGNHEFDDGWQEVRRLQSGGCHPQDGCREGQTFDGAQFRFLAANVRVDAENDTLFPAVDVREMGGVRLAFIGMTLEGTPDIVHPSSAEGLTFRDEVETVAELVPGLRAQGVETIVVVLHEGGVSHGGFDDCSALEGPIAEIAKTIDPAVDVIVSGHTHQAYVCELEGKLVTSAGSFGRLVTDIDLEIDSRTGDVVSAQAHNIIVRRDRSRDDITQLVADYAALTKERVDRQVGTIAADIVQKADGIGRSSLGVAIANAQLAAMQSEGGQVAFMNNGGIRAGLEFDASEGEASDGIVTYGEAFAVHPFGNKLLAQTLTAAQLQALLERQFAPGGEMLQNSSSLTYRATDGNVDLASIRIGGKALEPGDTVRVVSNDFIAGGKDGFAELALGVDRVEGPTDVDALCEYLAANPRLRPPRLSGVTVR